MDTNIKVIVNILVLKKLEAYTCFRIFQAVLWFTDALNPKSTLEEHSMLITDVRFSPSMTRLATSSFDKTVRVWDADNVYLFLTTVSLTFHKMSYTLKCTD